MRRGSPKQNPACLKRKNNQPRTDGALLIAASIVAAIRLRGEEIKPSPKLEAVVHDSIKLTKTVWARLSAK